MMEIATMISTSDKHASWDDIKSKAYDLLNDNRVDIEAISTYSVLCKVHGYHGEYETYVNRKARVYKDNDIDEANFFCTCDWGDISNSGNRPHDGADSSGSVKVNNRFCSHAYAAFMILHEYAKRRRGA
jgi:hypothetical protein